MSITKVKTFVALDPGPCECPVLSAMSQPFKYKHRAHLHSSYLPNPFLHLALLFILPSSLSSRFFLSSVYSWSHQTLLPATLKVCQREVPSECVGAETEGCFSIINYFTSLHIWLGSCLPKSLSSHGFPLAFPPARLLPMLCPPQTYYLPQFCPWSLYFPSRHCVLTTPKPMSLADGPLFIYWFSMSYKLLKPEMTTVRLISLLHGCLIWMAGIIIYQVLKPETQLCAWLSLVHQSCQPDSLPAGLLTALQVVSQAICNSNSFLCDAQNKVHTQMLKPEPQLAHYLLGHSSLLQPCHLSSGPKYL